MLSRSKAAKIEKMSLNSRRQKALARYRRDQLSHESSSSTAKSGLIEASDDAELA